MVIFTTSDGIIAALDVATGEILWRHATDAKLSSPVAYKDIVLVSASGALLAFDPVDGTQLWKLPLADTLTQPCIGGDLIVVVTDTGEVIALR